MIILGPFPDESKLSPNNTHAYITFVLQSETISQRNVNNLMRRDSKILSKPKCHTN